MRDLNWILFVFAISLKERFHVIAFFFDQLHRFHVFSILSLSRCRIIILNNVLNYPSELLQKIQLNIFQILFLEYFLIFAFELN